MVLSNIQWWSLYYLSSIFLPAVTERSVASTDALFLVSSLDEKDTINLCSLLFAHGQDTCLIGIVAFGLAGL